MAAYIQSHSRELRLGVVAYQPGDVIAEHDLLQLMDRKALRRLITIGCLRETVHPDQENQLAGGTPLTPSPPTVLQPPTPGGEGGTTAKDGISGQTSGTAEAVVKAWVAEGASTPSGTQDQTSSSAEGQRAVSDPELPEAGPRNRRNAEGDFVHPQPDSEVEEALPPFDENGYVRPGAVAGIVNDGGNNIVDENTKETVDLFGNHDGDDEGGGQAAEEPAPQAAIDGTPSDEVDVSDFASDEDGGFDPAEHTIAEVKAFVQENPDTRDDVLNAEQQGKNRSTLVTWLEEDDVEGSASVDETNDEV